MGDTVRALTDGEYPREQVPQLVLSVDTDGFIPHTQKESGESAQQSQLELFQWCQEQAAALLG